MPAVGRCFYVTMKVMEVLVKRLYEHALLPVYQTAGSAATDVAACLDEPVSLAPGERRLIPLGFALALPLGYEGQLRARSGLSLKYGVCLANGIGTIDSDYRGEVGVILLNLGTETFVVEHGMRIAQLVITRYERVSWSEVDQLEVTARGESGYGSTGH